MDKVINVKKLSTGTVLVFLMQLAIVIVFVIIILKPLEKERASLIYEIDIQKNNILIYKGISQKLPLLMGTNKKLQEKFFILQTRLAEEKDAMTFLRQISNEATASGLTVTSWKPLQKNIHSSKKVYEFPVEITAMSSYHKLGQFFSKLTKLNRIVIINNISVKHILEPSKKGANINVIFNAITYSLIPKNELSLKEKEI